MLLNVATGLSSRFEPLVVSLTSRLDMSEAVAQTGVEVQSLGMDGPASLPRAFGQLVRLCRRYRPDVVSTWMYHADLVGGLAARLCRVPALAWNIRNGDLSAEHSRLSTRALVRLNARLSRRMPDAIICCSEAARRIHVGLGYDADRFVVIPNGFDLKDYVPDPAAAASVRTELSIPAGAPLIGLIARWDPQKNHRGFVEAAAQLRSRRPDVCFLLAGSGVGPDNAELRAWIERAGIAPAVRLLGYRTDMPRLNAALDVATSTSIYGEAFPNVLGEAMACGVPCVTTDVGDSAAIVADTGRVVPPADTAALVAAWQQLLGLSVEERLSLGQKARERIRLNFEIGAVRMRYEHVFLRLASGDSACAE